jgi:hypothetical protein
MRRALAAMAALLFVIGCQPAIPPGDARVTGGVMPCSGLPLPGHVHFAAAQVTLLSGKVTWHPGPQGGPTLIDQLPTEVEATQRVGADEKYTFIVKPGDYVIQAVYLPVNDDGAKPYVSTTLRSGDDVELDIPSHCL